MGYYVKSVKNARSEERWKLQFISYKKVDTTHSSAQKPKKEWDVPKEEWHALRIRATMRLDVDDDG